MGWMDRFLKRAKTKGLLHAFTADDVEIPEGSDPIENIESLMKKSLKAAVIGTSNRYTSYVSQVKEAYKKYNAKSDYGNNVIRECTAGRVAAIMGEGVNIKANQPKVEQFLTAWAKEAGLIEGMRLTNGVIGSELTGYALFILKKDDDNKRMVVERVPYKPGLIVVKDPNGDPDNPTITLKYYDKNNKLVTYTPPGDDFVYIQTGGDDTAANPTTKLGIILTEAENYDRANKDLRINNFHFARTTPVFETQSAQETDQQVEALAQSEWEIGDGYVGTAKLAYVSPTTGAYENLKGEMECVIKVISGVTGVPLHWLGHADLLSNRSTAETLYEALKYATAKERTAWNDGLYRLFKKVLELSIDNRYIDLDFSDGFSVNLPLLDFTALDTRVRALSLAYHDMVISTGDYQNAIPGINPAETNKELESGHKYDPKLYMNTITPAQTGKVGGASENNNSSQ